MGTVRYTTVNGEVIAEKRNGVRRQYVPDPLGSTVALLDNTQAQVATATYWPYGEVRTYTGTTPVPFQFVGTQGYYSDGYLTQTVGRTYVRARYLHTVKARWLTQDPIGFSGRNTSLYHYASNQPVNQIDISGYIQSVRTPNLKGNNPWNGNAGIGNGQCPGKEVFDYLINLIATNKRCRDSVNKSCSNGFMQEVISMLLAGWNGGDHGLIHMKSCGPNLSACTKPESGFFPGVRCTPQYICINDSVCSGSKKDLATAFLWEMINWCECKYHQLSQNEDPAKNTGKACGLPAHAGGIIQIN